FGSFGTEDGGGRSSFIGLKRPSTRVGTTAKVHTPSPDFKPSNTHNLQEGMRVEHPKFGFGKVATVEMEGANRKALIQFENFGDKTLLLSFAKLRIVE